MILRQLYLSDPGNLPEITKATGLSLDELEIMVGRFTRMSQWGGQLRGVFIDRGDVLEIRHHFHKSKKPYWKEKVWS